jgi:hypothetical protein
MQNLPENLPGTLNLPTLIKTGSKLAPSTMNVSKLAPWMPEGLHQAPWMMQASKLAASTLDASKACSKQELGSFSGVKWNRLVFVISFLFNPVTLSIPA